MMNIHITENKEVNQEGDTGVSLPAFARSSLNRCNLPAVIIGSKTYQQKPVPLTIDGISALHGSFFRGLDDIQSIEERVIHFRQYMCAAFLLDNSEEAGLSFETCTVRRDKLDYLRLLRGWMFNSDGVEGAVMKRWVESRFGLLTINHCGLLQGSSSEPYKTYHTDYVRGLYNTNALESQLDLLYSFCQYELQRRYPEQMHWLLYRGVNHIGKHNNLGNMGRGKKLLLLNNLNSFSNDRDSSDTFGDIIFEAQVPATKLLYFPELLTGVLKGESEFLVIGGAYQVSIVY